MTGRTAPNRVQHRVVYQISENRQRLELISTLRAIWAMAAPVEFETEEDVPPEQFLLPLIVEHHVILEKASSELLELDERLQEQSSAAPVASSSLATEPDDVGYHGGGAASSALAAPHALADAADTWEDIARSSPCRRCSIARFC